MHQKTLNIHVITLFPDAFPGCLGVSVLDSAKQDGVWNLHLHHLRDFSQNKHFHVDDTPYGGGVGMVLEAETVARAIDHIVSKTDKRGTKIFYMSPRGKQLNQSFLHQLSGEHQLGDVMDIILLCGRYEGVDQRVLDHYNIMELSIGDYILAGGEVAAQVFIEGLLRLLPGVLGSHDSTHEESFENGLLEYPHYTKPSEWRGHQVPEVLLSGHHEKIKQWRLDQSKKITMERRPDLWRVFEAHGNNDGSQKDK